MKDSAKSKIPVAGMGLIFLFAALFVGMLPYFHIPLTDNEGLFVCIGQELGRGAKLYRDVWDHKPPVLFLHFWFLQKIPFDDIELKLHGYVLLVHFLNAYLLLKVARKWLGEKAWWCPTAYVVLTIPPYFEPWTPQADLLMGPIFLTTILLLQERRTSLKWFLVGGLTALGFFTKQTYLLFVPSFLVLGCDFRVIDLVAFLGGLDITACVVVTPFILDGRLDDLWQAIWGFNRRYLSHGWSRFLTHPEFQKGLLSWLPRLLGSYGIVLLGSLNFLLAKRKDGVSIPRSFIPIGFLFLWLITAVVMAVMSGYFFPYNFTPILLPFSIVFPLLLTRLNIRNSLAFGAVIFVTMVGPLYSWMEVCDRGVAALDWSGYSRERNSSAREMGAYLKEIMKPGDKLFCWSMEPQVFAYSGIERARVFKTPFVNHLSAFPEELLKGEDRYLAISPTYLLISRYDQVADCPGWLKKDLTTKWIILKNIGDLDLYKNSTNIDLK